jgi:hypothetical protein
VRVALAEGDAAWAQARATAGALGLERDVRLVAEAVQEVAVRLAPGTALVPADEDRLGLSALTGEPVEARVVPVDAQRDRGCCRPGKYGPEKRDDEGCPQKRGPVLLRGPARCKGWAGANR